MTALAAAVAVLALPQGLSRTAGISVPSSGAESWSSRLALDSGGRLAAWIESPQRLGLYRCALDANPVRINVASPSQVGFEFRDVCWSPARSQLFVLESAPTEYVRQSDQSVLMVTSTRLQSFSRRASALQRDWSIDLPRYVGRLRCSPDGRTLAAVADAGRIESDCAVVLLDAARGKVVQALRGLSGECGGVAFSGDSAVLVASSGERDRTPFMSTPSRPSAEPPRSAPEATVRAIPDTDATPPPFQRSPTSLLIGSMGYGRNAEPPKGRSYLCAWRVSDGKRIAFSSHHRGMSVGVPVLVDGGSRAVTVGEDRTLRLWDVKTGRELARAALKKDVEVRGSLAGVGIVAEEADASWTPSGTPKGALLAFDPANLRRLGTLPGDGMATSMAGRLAVVWKSLAPTGADPLEERVCRLSLRTYESGRPKTLASRTEFSGKVRTVAIDEARRCAVVATDRGLVTLSAPNRAPSPPEPGSRRVSLLTDPEGRCLVWTHGWSDSDVRSVCPGGVPWRALSLGTRIGARVVSPTRIWTWDRASLRLVDATNGEAVAEGSVGRLPTAVAASSGGERTAYFVPPDRLVVTDGEHPTGRAVPLRFQKPDDVVVDVSANGATVLASDGAVAYALRGATLERIAVKRGLGTGELSPSGEHVVAWDEGTPVTLLSLRSLRSTTYAPDTEFRFSDSGVVATWSGSGEVRVDDLASGRRVATVARHALKTRPPERSFVRDAVLTRDGRGIAVLYSDGTLLSGPLGPGAGSLRAIKLVQRAEGWSEQGSMSLSPDFGRVLVRWGSDLVCVDRSTMREAWRLEVAAPIEAMAYAPDGTSIYVATDLGQIRRASAKDGHVVERRFVPVPGVVRSIGFDRVRGAVVLHALGWEGVSTFFEADPSRPCSVAFCARKGVGGLGVSRSPDGTLSGLWNEGINSFVVCRNSTGETLAQGVSSYPIRDVRFSADGSLAVASAYVDDSSGVTEHTAWRLADGRRVASHCLVRPLKGGVVRAPDPPFVDPRGRYFCDVGQDGVVSVTPTNGGETRRLAIPSEGAGFLHIRAGALSADGGLLAVFLEDGRVATLDPLGGSPMVRIADLGVDPIASAMEDAPPRIVFSSTGDRFAIQAAGWVRIFRREATGPVREGSFAASPGGDLSAVRVAGADCLYGESDGGCWLRSFADAAPLMEVVPGPEGGWVASTADGRYDGDRQALASMSVVRGLDTIPLERLTYADAPEAQLTVGLVQEVASGHGSDATASAPMRPPSVRLAELPARTAASRVRLDLLVSDGGGGLSKAWVWRNGRLAAVEDLARLPGGHGRASVVVQLDAGANEIVACAFSSTGVRSPRAVAHVRYTGDPRRHRLYALVVGTGDCRLPGFPSLSGATKDAVRVGRDLEAIGSVPGADPPVVRHLETNASEGRVEEAVRGIASDIRGDTAQATFVFYFAGHGRLDRSGYEVLMHDGVGGSAFVGVDRLRAWSERLLDADQVWIVDACDSGNAQRGLDALQQEFAAENRGLCVIAGTDKMGLAVEMDEEGVLTKAFLEALRDPRSARGGALDVRLVSKVVREKAGTRIVPYISPVAQSRPVWMGRSPGRTGSPAGMRPPVPSGPRRSAAPLLLDLDLDLGLSEAPSQLGLAPI